MRRTGAYAHVHAHPTSTDRERPTQAEDAHGGVDESGMRLIGMQIGSTRTQIQMHLQQMAMANEGEEMLQRREAAERNRSTSSAAIAMASTRTSTGTNASTSLFDGGHVHRLNRTGRHKLIHTGTKLNHGSCPVNVTVHGQERLEIATGSRASASVSLSSPSGLAITHHHHHHYILHRSHTRALQPLSASSVNCYSSSALFGGKDKRRVPRSVCATSHISPCPDYIALGLSRRLPRRSQLTSSTQPAVAAPPERLPLEHVVRPVAASDLNRSRMTDSELASASEHETAANNTIRTRRRQFSTVTVRKALPGRSLLLEDSDSDHDGVRSSTVAKHEVPDPITSPSFQDIISKLEVGNEATHDLHAEKYSASPRTSTSSVPDTRPQSSDMYLSRRSRPSRQMLKKRAFSKELPALPGAGDDCESEVRRHSAASAPPFRHPHRRRSGSPLPSSSLNGSFVSLVETQGLEKEDLETLRLLKRRQAILRELVTTEISFFQDMAVVVQEYQRKASGCPTLGAEDARQIFGGVEPVMNFSNDFAADLQTGAAAVLFSEATSLEVLRDEDAQSSVGNVFGQSMGRLAKVFSRYCTTHEKAATCLQRMTQDPVVQAWLAERHPTDRTTAWDLPSLLIKPVQRVLKYPLLLSSLLEATPKAHTDYYAIDLALKEMLLTAENINNIKKRRDLVVSIAGADKKRSDFSGIAKTFSRRTAKLKLNVGLDEDFYDNTDPELDGLAARFRAQQAVLQTLQSEIRDYFVAMASSLEYHAQLAAAFQEVVVCEDAPPPSLTPAVEWSEYTAAVSELQQGALVELSHNLEREVFQPLRTIEATYRNPRLVLAERDRKLADFCKARISKSKGSNVDKNTLESAEQFTHLNDTLIQELPLFLATTMKAMDVVTARLATVQKTWLLSWSLRLGTLIAPEGDPQDITPNFRDRQAIMAVHMSEIGLTNGNLLMDRVLDGKSTRSSDDNSSMSDTSFKIPGTIGRPSMRFRALSVANNATMSLKKRSPSAPLPPSPPSLSRLPRTSYNSAT